MASPNENEVVLTDARSIRALAHPARIIVVEALYDRNLQLSATQAAALAGVSPSAMSYHLRALERAGIVTLAPASPDRRQRPWMRAGSGLAIRPEAGFSRAMTAATGAIVSVAIDQDRLQLLAALERRQLAKDPESTEMAAGYWRTSLRLTRQESIDILAKITALVEPFTDNVESERTGDKHLASLAITMIPQVEPPGVTNPERASEGN